MDRASPDPERPRGLAPGTRVRVIGGLLSEQIGVLAALRPHERVLVLLRLLGGQHGSSSQGTRSRRLSSGL